MTSDGYMIGIDQSTQGTKAILLNRKGEICEKAYRTHTQKISDQGWVSHDPEEIYANTLAVVRDLAEKTDIRHGQIAAVGISNQRETTVAWNRKTGKPVTDAIVWQCARAVSVTDPLTGSPFAEKVREKTGIVLSPYFPAAKAAWILKNVPETRTLAESGDLCIGTVDAWLVYRLTGGTVFATDYSNASRTQLFNLHTLAWDPEICEKLDIPISALPFVQDSDGDFGRTDFDGLLDEPVPICGVLGDSHAALFGQGCVVPGMAKATFGTGSSVMMHIGPVYKKSHTGLVTSLAWGRGGSVDYVFEGNINYAGAVITWLQTDLELIRDAGESETLANAAHPEDTTYLVPAFTGLGAPYWDSDARGIFCGMSRTTGRAELVKAGLESIAYQVADIALAMASDAGTPLKELRADGGPTGNGYLMQFLSDISGSAIRIPKDQELSAMGAAFMAGMAVNFYPEDMPERDRTKRICIPQMSEEVRSRKRMGWTEAVHMALHR